MKKSGEALLIGGIVAGAVVLYFLLPYVYRFVAGHSGGVSGLLLLLGVGLAVFFIFFLMGNRGKDLVRAAVLIAGIALMIWLYFNFPDLDAYVAERFGQGAAWIFFLALALLIFLFTRFV